MSPRTKGTSPRPPARRATDAALDPRPALEAAAGSPRKLTSTTGRRATESPDTKSASNSPRPRVADASRMAVVSPMGSPRNDEGGVPREVRPQPPRRETLDANATSLQPSELHTSGGRHVRTRTPRASEQDAEDAPSRGRAQTLPHVDLGTVGVEEALRQAEAERSLGHFRRAVEWLLPFAKADVPLVLAPKQERAVAKALVSLYIALMDFQRAEPHAQRNIHLTQAISGPRSQDHARALKVLSTVQIGLNVLVAARASIEEALAILRDLGPVQDETHGAALVVLGDVDRKQGRYSEALATYCLAEVELAPFKEGSDYVVVLMSKALCLRQLQQVRELRLVPVSA